MKLSRHTLKLEKTMIEVSKCRVRDEGIIDEARFLNNKRQNKGIFTLYIKEISGTCRSHKAEHLRRRKTHPICEVAKTFWSQQLGYINRIISVHKIPQSSKEMLIMYQSGAGRGSAGFKMVSIVNK